MSKPRSLMEAILGAAVPDGPPEAEDRPRALAWARVSTDMQEERGLSIPEQLREIREYATKNGIQIVGEFQETGSGFREQHKREVFHQMLAAARSDSHVSAIVVHDFSRFSRDMARAMTVNANKTAPSVTASAGVRLTHAPKHPQSLVASVNQAQPVAPTKVNRSADVNRRVNLGL